jgi:hypothetical protein
MTQPETTQTLHTMFEELRMLGDNEHDLFSEHALTLNQIPERFAECPESYTRIKDVYLDWYRTYDGRESLLYISRFNDKQQVQLLLLAFSNLIRIHKVYCENT